MTFHTKSEIKCKKNQLPQNQLVTEIAPISGVISPLQRDQKNHSSAIEVIQIGLGAAIKLNRAIIKKPVDILKP